MAGLQDCRKGRKKRVAAFPLYFLQFCDSALLQFLSLAVLADSRRRAALREDRTKLPAFIEQPRALFRFTHLAVFADLEPQLAFGFFKYDTESGREFGMRAGTTRAPVVTGNSESRASELSSDCVAGRCSWEGVDEVEDGDGEAFRADFQVFGGFVHVVDAVQVPRPRIWRPFREIKPLNISLSAIPAILQFCNFCHP
jgi:hypothetical protein